MHKTTETFWQSIATAIIWGLLLAISALAFIFLGETLGENIIGLMFILIVGGVTSTGFVWKWGRVDASPDNHQATDADWRVQSAKRKNGDQLSQALRNLSNDELVDLRDKLAHGNLDDDDLDRLLGDDTFPPMYKKPPPYQ